MNLQNVRAWQLKQLEYGVKTVESLLSILNPADLNTYRDGGTGWTFTEVLGHLRDFEGVFLQRARLTVEQDNPPLPFPNPDELAIANAYNSQLPHDLLAAWKAERETLLAFFAERNEDDWERPAQHPTRGNLTLHDQLFLLPQHDSLHLEQMTRILAEKKS